MIRDSILYYNYGGFIDPDGTATTNYTHAYNTHAVLDNFAYSVDSFYSIAGDNDDTGYQPIAALNMSDADLSLMLIAANSVQYVSVMDDPIFGAHIPMNITGFGTVYSADAYMTVLGCREQYRLCNPLNGRCTPFLGALQVVNALFANQDGLELSVRQNPTAIRLTTPTQFTTQYQATLTRRGGALRVTENLSDLTQMATIPVDQWQIEVSAWFDTGLAKLQAQVQQLAASTVNWLPGSRLQAYTAENTSPMFYHFCRSQLVNDSAGSTSFSVLGLAILLIVGGLIILVSLTIDTVVGFIQRKTGRGPHARMEWLFNDRLQTHMMLMRELHLGQWYDGLVQKIPKTIGSKHKFLGPSERELCAQRSAQGAEGETGVQLVQHENVTAHDGKWLHT